MNIERQYLELLENVLKNGTLKENRTGTSAITYIPTMIQHDMNEGFPLLTTKKMGIKSIAAELEFFIKGFTNKQWLKNRKCTIWNEWHNKLNINHFENKTDDEYSKEDNDLGPIYGYQWRNFNKDYKKIPTIHTNFDKNVHLEGTETDKFIGQKFNNKYGEYIVEKKLKDNRYQIVFTQSGYRNNYKKDNIIKNNIKDLYYPSNFGVGCLGNYIRYEKIYTKEVVNSLKLNWIDFIKKCYNENYDEIHEKYFNKINVDNKWLVFEYFLEDVNKMKNWNKKKELLNEMTIERLNNDGDYTLDNCIFLHKKEQIKNRSNSIFYNVFKNNILIYENIHLKDLTIKIKIPDYTIKRLCDKNEERDGYKFIQVLNKSKLNNEGYDQFRNIINTLKSDPNNRRMLCSAWNPLQFNEMALPPCHVMWGVQVLNNKLNLWWTQRSVDLFLGLGYNISSYALLLKLLAKESGLEEGILTGFLSDIHIYENHVNQVKEQISRTTYELPNLEITNFKDIFNWKYTDLELINYNSHPSIKAPVAV